MPDLERCKQKLISEKALLNDALDYVQSKSDFFRTKQEEGIANAYSLAAVRLEGELEGINRVLRWVESFDVVPESELRPD